MKPRIQKSKTQLHLLSDSSGNLIEHFFNAILTQFPKNSFKVYNSPFIETDGDLLQAMGKIKSGIICHAFADRRLKALLEDETEGQAIPCWDITGPTQEFLERSSNIKVSKEIQPLHSVDANYLGRMAAMEFALQHDDNRRLDRLDEADIILVGISRVSKSPNAVFLAYRGFRVANVAIVPAEGLPPRLARHRRKNVVALSIQPRKLSEIRERRFSRWDLDEFDYTDLTSVIHEVRDAEEIFKNKSWPIIDTTNLAVEETSSLILERLNIRDQSFQ